MVFENPFKYRRKGDRRSYSPVPIIPLVIFLILLLSAFILYPSSDGVNTKSIGIPKISPAIEAPLMENTDSSFYAHTGSNPEPTLARDRMMNRISRIKRLPDIIPNDKTFVHTAFIRQLDHLAHGTLIKHAKQLDITFPDWFSLDISSGSVSEHIDWNVLETLSKNNSLVIPTFSVSDDSVSMAMFSEIISNQQKSAKLIDDLKLSVRNRSVKGLNIDVSTISEPDRILYTSWLLSLTESFHNSGLYVTVSVPVNNRAYDYSAIGALSDLVVLKAYDEHSEKGAAGPVSGIYWFKNSIDAVSDELPPSKTIIAIGTEGYDWNISSGATPEKKDFERTMRLARNSGANIQWGKISFNNAFRYEAGDGDIHEVWFPDAVSSWNQYSVIRQQAWRGAALSDIGGEDVSIWDFMHPDSDKTFKPESLKVIKSEDRQYVMGSGAFFEVSSVGSEGVRELSLKWNIITNSRYTKLPDVTSVSKYGVAKDKTVAIAILGIPGGENNDKVIQFLKNNSTRATFFPTLEQIRNNSDAVYSEYKNGNVIGGFVSSEGKTPEQFRSELDDIGQYLKRETGRSTMLAMTQDEVSPGVRISNEQAGKLQSAGGGGYILASQGVPSDSLLDLAADSIASKLRDSGANVITVDGYKNNGSNALSELERIIPTLISAGYSFVTMDEILGMKKDEVMPGISSSEQLAIYGQIIAESAKKWSWYLLLALFLLTTVVSMVRIIFLGIFVYLSYRKRRTFDKTYKPTGYAPPVTILVPAYNEEKVIARTVLGLLGSEYPKFEILVVDDGSKDGTAEEVAKITKEHKNVRIISKKNEGKSVALNLGFREARYDYVITVDADTIVFPNTVKYLMEPFADDKVDAVCGNIGVGNVTNVLTAFQEVEYVTGQNYDRRAFDALNCISVVPGATGAWRKQKVLDIGGYSSDTLVEDADLTLTMLEQNGKIVYAPHARSVTEAPETVLPLFKQRFRWSYGTFQCFWKHRHTLGKGTLGNVALPNMLFFQVLFPALAPIGDAVLLVSIFTGQMETIIIWYGVFFVMDFLITGIAYALDKKSMSNVWIILIQRFFYRQFMYVVTFKSIIAALAGSHHGWNKLERKGTVEVTT